MVPPNFGKLPGDRNVIKLFVSGVSAPQEREREREREGECVCVYRAYGVSAYSYFQEKLCKDSVDLYSVL